DAISVDQHTRQLVRDESSHAVAIKRKRPRQLIRIEHARQNGHQGVHVGERRFAEAIVAAGQLDGAELYLAWKQITPWAVGERARAGMWKRERRQIRLRIRFQRPDPRSRAVRHVRGPYVHAVAAPSPAETARSCKRDKGN